MRGGVSPFVARPNSTVSLSATTSSGSTTVAFNASSSTAAVCTSVRVVNSGTAATAVELGGSSVVATVPNGGTPGSFVLAPNEARVFSTNGATHAAAITTTGTATVYLTPGEGGY